MILYKENYNYSVEINNKKIYFRPWNTLDEKNYLLNISSRDDENVPIDDLWNILIIPCIKDKNIELTEIEKKYLMIKMREISIGDDIEIRYICNHDNCKTVNEINININDVLEYKNNNFQTIKYDEIEITFNEPKTQNLKNRLKEYEINTFNYNFINFLIHIESYKYNDILYEHFSFEELKQFFESVPSKIYNKLYKEFTNMLGKISFNIETKCITCGNTNIIETENIPNFLWV